MITISNSESYSEYMKVAASFSFRGWGVKAKASFAMENENSYSNSDVRLNAFRKIVYGYEGYSVPPPLS